MNLRNDRLPVVQPPSSLAGKEDGISRRTLLKAAAGGGLLVAIGSKFIPFSQAMEEVKSEYALIIDLNKCTGCGACAQACNQRNDLPEGKSFIAGEPVWEITGESTPIYGAIGLLAHSTISILRGK